MGMMDVFFSKVPYHVCVSFCKCKFVYLLRIPSINHSFRPKDGKSGQQFDYCSMWLYWINPNHQSPIQSGDVIQIRLDFSFVRCVSLFFFFDLMCFSLFVGSINPIFNPKD